MSCSLNRSSIYDTTIRLGVSPLRASAGRGGPGPARALLLAAALLAPASLRAQPEAPDLAACIAAALEDNPGVQSAEWRAVAAASALDQAQSASYPQIGLSAGYARTDNPPQAFMMRLNQRQLRFDGDFNNPDDADNLRLSAGASYLLYDGGRRALDRRMAKLGAEAGEAHLAAARNELVHQVTRAYYRIRQAKALVEVHTQAVRSLEEGLRAARARFEAGSALKSDVLHLEVQLAQAREDLVRARNAVRLSVAALNTAVGRELAAEDQAWPSAEEGLDAPPAEDLARAEDRPELQAVREDSARLRAAWQRTRRDYAPRLHAFGSVDWDSDVSSDFEQSYLAGVALEWQAFTGFGRGAAVRRAEAEWQAAEAGADQVARQTRLELKEAHLQASESWERLAVARGSVELAEEALRLVRVQYEEGAAEVTTLLVSEAGLTAARSRALAARYDYLVALSNVERARGALGAMAAERPSP